MSWVNALMPWGLIVACMGFVQAGSPPKASPPKAYGTAEGRPAQRLYVSDVKLDSDGSLRGVVINLQGVPVANTLVVIHKADREVVRTATDAFGCFSADDLLEGTYRLSAGGLVRRIRTWVASAAPPRAGQLALFVLGNQAVRGHGMKREAMASDSVIRTGMRPQ